VRALRTTVWLVTLVLVASAPLLAQTPPRGGGRLGQRGGPPPPPPTGGEDQPALPRGGGAGLSDAQLQVLLDRWAIAQTERQLDLTDEQRPDFRLRLQRLHNLQRRQQQERLRLLQELQAVAAAPGPIADESAVAAKLKAFDNQAVQLAQQIRRAYAAIDEVLSVRQRVRFRIVEEQLERRKLELLMQARRGGGGGRS
jgi:Spy/CpxP family protein refolding chaperone